MTSAEELNRNDGTWIASASQPIHNYSVSEVVSEWVPSRKFHDATGYIRRVTDTKKTDPNTTFMWLGELFLTRMNLLEIHDTLLDRWKQEIP